MSPFDPLAGMDMSVLPPEIQARLMRPQAPPLPDLGIGGPPVPEVATRLMPHDQPGGSFMDRLAMALAASPVPQATDSRGAFGQNLLAGAAQGFARPRLFDMQQRQDMQKQATEAAKTLNAHRWKSYDDQNKERIKFLQAQSVAQTTSSPAAVQSKAQAARAGTLAADAANEQQANAAQKKEMGLTPDQPATTKDYLHFKGTSSGGGGGGLFGGNPQNDIVRNIADAIESGDQPPILTGLYRYAGPVRGELAKRKFNVSKELTQWTAIQKETSALNSPQQTQTRQAAGTVLQSYDLIDELAGQLAQLAPQTRAIPINKLVNMTLRDFGPNGVAAQKVALNLRSAIADAVPLQANVYMAGGVPSDKAMQQAAVTINADRSPDLILNDTKLQRRLMNYRLKNIGGTTAQQPADMPWNGPGPAPPMLFRNPQGGGGQTIHYDLVNGKLVQRTGP